MRRYTLIFLALAACAAPPNETDEERRERWLRYVNETRIWADGLRPIAEELVASGRVHRDEVDTVYAALDAGLAGIELAVSGGDEDALTKARTAVLQAAAKLLVLASKRDDSSAGRMGAAKPIPEAPPEPEPEA